MTMSAPAFIFTTMTTTSSPSSRQCKSCAIPSGPVRNLGILRQAPNMDIRVLRGAEVRQLLPMAECIDLMQRTMIAVSEGRVVLPLRSILVMPGYRGMMGMLPGDLTDPECIGIKL